MRLTDGRIRIMLVDDDEDDFVVMREMLSGIQHWEAWQAHCLGLLASTIHPMMQWLGT